MSSEETAQPFEGNYYTKRRPDSAYTLELQEKNQRLKAEIDKKNNALLDSNNTSKEMVNLLKSNEDLLEEQIELTKLQRPQGKTYEMAITLPVNAPLAHIDFIVGTRNNMSSLPANTNIEFPFAKLYSLEITNDGPASIVFSTNQPRNSGKADSRLLANESDDLGTWPFPTFETLNVGLAPASVSGAAVRIRGLA